MRRLKLLATIALASFMLTGCPEPDPNRDISFTIPRGQLNTVTTKGKDIGVFCIERVESIKWSIVNKPQGSHPIFTDTEKTASAGYYKHFKTDKAGAYTIKVEVESRGKKASETADMNVTEVK
jgi:hypothetical protein